MIRGKIDEECESEGMQAATASSSLAFSSISHKWSRKDQSHLAGSDKLQGASYAQGGRDGNGRRSLL